jgi:ATP-binding cassette subfamily C (CFTR/MRP) protein 1
LFKTCQKKEHYAAVIEACALTSDLEQLPDGDQTEIGEKGINLSGGQKQRVAIARAVYADADVYLLDDCLSAVDSQVAHHIFTKCIRHPSMLRSKAVLLVSHNLGLLPQADKVCLLDHKTSLFVGDYQGFIELDNDLAAAARKDQVY